MVKKIIACSDIHVRNLSRLDETKEVIETFIEQCKTIAGTLEKDELRIVLAGDIFENKITISNEANIVVGWMLKKLSEVAKTVVICGNHDCLVNNKERIDSISQIINIGNYENVLFVDGELDYESGIIDDDNISWCLYSIFDNYNRPNIEVARSTAKEEQKFVGLIHADVNGAVTDTKNYTENGIDPDIFDNLDFVIAGHIHKRQEIKKNGVKLVYCGSLIQKDNGENVNGHGFILWDVETDSYEYVNTPNQDYGLYKFLIKSENDIKDNKEKLLNL